MMQLESTSEAPHSSFPTSTEPHESRIYDSRNPNSCRSTSPGDGDLEAHLLCLFSYIYILYYDCFAIIICLVPSVLGALRPQVAGSHQPLHQGGALTTSSRRSPPARRGAKEWRWVEAQPLLGAGWPPRDVAPQAPQAPEGSPFRHVCPGSMASCEQALRAHVRGPEALFTWAVKDWSDEAIWAIYLNRPF